MPTRAAATATVAGTDATATATAAAAAEGGAATGGEAATTGATGAEVAARGLGVCALAAATLVATVGAAPASTIELKVSRAGFVPARIVLHRGETVRILITSDDGEHCFAVDALRVEKRVTKGRTTTVELTPERAGSYVYYCCLETGAQAARERGELVVTD
jgi:heme/copper-type cytochrome/quinol oxidase subunit 2